MIGLLRKAALAAGLLAWGAFSAQAATPFYPTSQFNYANITTDTTTTVKSGQGVLHTVCINTPAATETIKLYDNTAASGTVIGTITEYASVGGCFAYDIAFINGLTAVTATAAGDITITYK